MRSSKDGKLVSRAVRLVTASAAALLVATVAAAGPANADEGHAGRVNTAGPPLTVRSGPGTDYPVVKRLADGTRVTVDCQTQGESVTGTYGTSTWWDRLSSGGYVSDAYVYTGKDGRIADLCPNSGAAAQQEKAEQSTTNQSAATRTIPSNLADGTPPTMMGRDLFDETPIRVSIPKRIPGIGGKEVGINQSVFGFDVWNEKPRQNEDGSWSTLAWRYHWQWGSPNPANDRVVTVRVTAQDEDGKTYLTQVFDNRPNGSSDDGWFNPLGNDAPMSLKPGMICATLFSSGVQKAQVCHGI